MALSAKQFSFLLSILLISSILVQARESKFFSKFNHYQQTDTPNTTTTPNNNNSQENELNHGQVPAVKQEEEQTSNGYGLYGRDSNQFPSTTTENSQEYTYPNNAGKTSTPEYTGGSYEDEEVNTNGNYGYKKKQYGMSDTRFMDNPNVNNNNGYETKQFDSVGAKFIDNGNVNSNNGYETKQYGGRDGTDNRLFDNGYKTNQYSTAANENNNKPYGEESLSKSKQQGLSDTRFMENGKYFYNVNNENSYLNNYQPENRRYDGFNPSQAGTSRNNYNYGNNEKEYEFNNSQYQGEDNQDVFSP